MTSTDTPLPASRPVFAGVPFDNFERDRLLGELAARDPSAAFAYIVTPNVDHVVRLHRSAGDSRDGFGLAYRDAFARLCDSRIIGLLARVRGVSLAVLPGSDLTVALFESLIGAGDRIAIVGGTLAELEELRRRYPAVSFAQHIPPMGLRDDPAAMADAAAFVERQSARFVFLAVGSPQQEVLASLIRKRGTATGMGLCVGAAIAFLAESQSRAPPWMQRVGLEWLYRLLQDPRRLWRRYLVDGPRIFRIAFNYRGVLPTFDRLRGVA